MCNEHKFKGQGQRPVVVAPGELLLDILTKLHKQYPRVDALIKALNRTGIRYLGGDTSLAREVHQIRQAQEQLPDNHPLRAFAEPVESGRVGNLASVASTSTATTPAVEWFFARHDTKEATKTKNAALKEAMPNAKPEHFIAINKDIGRMSTGMYPADFKRANGVKAYKATRDHMTSEQLAVVYNAERAATRMLSSGGADGFSKNYEQYSSLIYEANKLSGIYETSQPSGPPKLDEAEKALLEHKKHERDVARIEAPPPPPKRPRLVDNRTTNNNNRCTINYFFGRK